MAGLVSRLPVALSGRTSAAGSATYALQDVPYDVAIGGMPFLSGSSDDRPYMRGLAQMRKDQFDNQREPGEQSLASWWLRSQATFIGGAGLLYQDPDQVQVANLQNKHAIQFNASVGVSPWVNGKLTLLRSTSQRIADASANRHLLLGWNDGTDRYWSAVGNALKSDTGAAVTTITWGGANTIRSLTSDGTNYFAADNVGIYKGAGNGAGSLVYNTGSVNTLVKWVKGRLMAAVDNKVYELVAAGPTLPAAKFTHLNAGFVFTDFAEGTNAIYASGNAGSQGSIYKFVLDTTGNVPTLASGGVITAQLPLGETVLAMTTYLGTFVGIGTSRGFRVGQIDTNGDIVYGPLIIENASGVKAISAYDRFFFVGATNSIDSTAQSGLYRVDLGQPISDSGSSAGLRFAYTTDLQALVTGEVCSVTNFGNSDRMALAVVAQGAYLESATQKVASGYLTTGRVRYNTLEPKIFKFVSVKTPSSQFGSVTASVIEPGGAETSIITVSEGSSLAIDNVILTAPTAASEWIALKMTLTRSATDPTKGGEVNGWQLKAMPGGIRQRLITIPLMMFDFESDRSGQKQGYEGRTAERLAAFENIAQAGDAVSFQDLNAGMSTLAVVDDYQFLQKASPGPNRTSYGGYLTVQLRTIADVITT